MIHRISQKRTGQEQADWERVRGLMPRGRKTRGLQYETLEYLFAHLYERVSETELRNHLEEVKGGLQKTGDPVKGAINQAIKELQRLRERPFDISKIQKVDESGRLVRYVRLNYNRYDSVIGFSEYREYLQDLLEGESRLLIRLTVAHLGEEAAVFPGFARWSFDDHRVEAVLCLSAQELVSRRNWDCRFVPDSPLGGNMLLVYENEQASSPFLGFICDDDRTNEENSQFILYRGQGKGSKLKFLDRLWRAGHRRAISQTRLEEMIRREQYTDSAHLQGMLLEQCMSKRTSEGESSAESSSK